MNCHDCDCKEGEYHTPGCDMERCPFCGGQLISCNCAYKKLKLIDKKKNGTKYDGLTKEIYYNGLSDEQNKKWNKILEKKGLIPYVVIPNLCRLCGKQWPKMFMVSNRDWKKYIIPPLQDEMLCKKCYNRMKKMFPHGWKKI